MKKISNKGVEGCIEFSVFRAERKGTAKSADQSIRDDVLEDTLGRAQTHITCSCMTCAEAISLRQDKLLVEPAPDAYTDHA